jgi:hypothetical protein
VSAQQGSQAAPAADKGSPATEPSLKKDFEKLPWKLRDASSAVAMTPSPKRWEAFFTEKELPRQNGQPYVPKFISIKYDKKTVYLAAKAKNGSGGVVYVRGVLSGAKEKDVTCRSSSFATYWLHRVTTDQVDRTVLVGLLLGCSGVAIDIGNLLGSAGTLVLWRVDASFLVGLGVLSLVLKLGGLLTVYVKSVLEWGRT